MSFNEARREPPGRRTRNMMPYQKQLRTTARALARARPPTAQRCPQNHTI